MPAGLLKSFFIFEPGNIPYLSLIHIFYNGEEISAGRGGFRIKVEAVDEEWFVAKPDSGSEAFEFFEESMAIPDGELL